MKMKNYLYKTLIAFVLFAQSSLTFAYDFVADGIYYNIINSDQVEVTYNVYRHPDGSYSGTIQIPENVKYNNVEYRVTSIGYEAFTYSSINNLIIPNSVSVIGESAFFYCKLESITLSTTLESIGKSAFSGCENLKSITIPNSVTSIGERAFEDCGLLESVTLPNQLETIPDYLFWGSNLYLTSISIPSSVKTIGKHAFDNCAFTSITIPEGVLTIGEGAFQSCNKLLDISIPSTVTSIGDYAFASSGRSIEIVVSNIQSPFSIPDNVFKDIKATAVLQVPKGTKSNYQNYNGWTCYFSSIEEFNSVNCYNLSIKSIGSGSATFNELIIRNETKTITVDEGTSATITFSPDSGNKIKSVKINDTDVTSSVSDNQYTISSITGDTNVEVEFEPITYTLSIKASGNGSASYSGSTIKNETSTFTVDEGSSATITFSPDSGNKIKSVKVNDTDVTSSVSSNQYTINSITGDTNVEVEFEAITYTLSVKATGSGAASYDGTTIRDKTSTFTVNEGTAVSISIYPDNGYRIKSVKENDTDVTSYVSDGIYTINSISRDTEIEVEFEAIPATTYSLSIKATGNGSASYDGNTIRNTTSTFAVNEGATATISFSPDDGYQIKSVKVNDNDVTSSVSDNQYTINNISADTNVEVEFEEITYTLSIKATGNGYVKYKGKSIRDNTKTFTVKKGASAIISFSPNNGYKVKIVKVNDMDVTSSVSDNQYTISNISVDTNVEVEFDVAMSYSLSIKATGKGEVTFDGNTIRNSTSTFNVYEGTSAQISFSPDSDYRIKSVKVNGTDVTSSVTSNQYIISNITGDTNVEVEFEPYYTLTIFAMGKGSANYNDTDIRNGSNDYIVSSGTTVSILLTPDNGYRIKSVKENEKNVTSYVSDGKYTIDSISRNTFIDVIFEAIPATTYTLSIKATGDGSISYDGNTVRNTTSTFTINEGASAKIAFSPDSGYRIKNVKVNSTDVTSSVSGNQYTISNIASDTSVEVEFEAIPVNTYTLSIVVAGNGSATYNDTDVRNGSETFTVNEGATVIVVFSPDNGNRLNTVKMNGTDVTSQVSGNSYTINNIAANTNLEVTFKEDVNALTVDGVNYSVVSQSDKTVNVVGGNYGKVLTVPATVTSNGTTWKVVGVEADALNGNTELAAIIWNPEVAFTAAVSNPNLLLYVKAEEYAPAAIQNVVVNGTASKIVLKEAGSGNGFYCPQAFTAQQISYTHNYQMQTGIGESKGWETIALPFDVQTITHETKGTIVPFAQWNNESDKKPFWLMELTGTGFVETNEIKAYTPYIISMPNHPQYDSRWLLNGRVTFAASGVTVGKTENLNQPTFSDRTFVPCFADMGSDMGIYALNVNNDFETNNSGMTEGSKFVLNMRSVHPFEAYMTSSSSAPCYAIGVFEDMTTGIQQMVDGRWSKDDVVYDLQGRRVERPSKKGMYMINGKKMIIK